MRHFRSRRRLVGPLFCGTGDGSLLALAVITISPNAEFVKAVSWEKQIALPMPGLLVKGCLDECSICESELEKKLDLELEHIQLENELLKKKISLLEKSQEYRCCPGDANEPVQPNP